MGLTPFEGNEVVQVGVELPGAAGGLRAALRVDPREFHQGDKVYVVHETTCTKVRFEPIDKSDPKGPQRRVHVLAVASATTVDADLVATQLDAQRERIEAAKGIQRLPYDDEGELGLAHARGEHADAMAEGCPACDLERDRALAEQAGDEPADPPAATPIRGRKRRAGGADPQ